ncbi:hypothetical protein HPP92_028353 [Vanilla planifolia]|uniref:Uncharacterized protein n=1 Tax=Vanilla planifolia TaxID=51239 RepID=A0A835U4D7_VANPL|nr:hypothetical protein HPP92_028353 [Vanilla planifolia]
MFCGRAYDLFRNLASSIILLWKRFDEPVRYIYPMKRKLRSSVPCSAEELLSSAESEVLSKSGRSKIRSLIWSFGPSYGIVSSLPSALHVHVDQSLDSLKQYLKSGKTESVASGAGDRSSCSPPFKSFKNSSRLKRSDDHEDEATLPEPGLKP